MVFALATQAIAPRPAPMPALPLTQLDERAPAGDLDKRAFTLTFAQPVAVQDLLLLLVRDTSLSIVPDPAIDGTFIGELKNVTVRQALGLILRPLGLDYTRRGQRHPRVAAASRRRGFSISTTSRRAHGAGDGRRGRRIAEQRQRDDIDKADVFEELTNGVRTLLTSAPPSTSIGKPDCCR